MEKEIQSTSHMIKQYKFFKKRRVLISVAVQRNLVAIEEYY